MKRLTADAVSGEADTGKHLCCWWLAVGNAGGTDHGAVHAVSEVVHMSRPTCRSCKHRPWCLERSRGYPCRDYQSERRSSVDVIRAIEDYSYYHSVTGRSQEEWEAWRVAAMKEWELDPDKVESEEEAWQRRLSCFRNRT